MKFYPSVLTENTPSKSAASRALIVLCLCIASASHAKSACAALLTVTNPSFENPALADGGFTNNAVPGWNVVGSNNFGAGVFDPNFAFSGIDGENIAFLGPLGQPANSLKQILVDTLATNTLYTLTVRVGNRGTDSASYGGYVVQLLAGGVLLAQDQDSFIPTPFVFQTATVQFQTGALHPQLGTQLEIRLGTSNGLGQTDFDLVQLDASAASATVPEPSSLALWGISALCCSLAGHRRRKAAYGGPTQ